MRGSSAKTQPHATRKVPLSNSPEFAASQIFNFFSALVSKEVELLRELQDLKKTINAVHSDTKATRCIQTHTISENGIKLDAKIACGSKFV